MLVLFGTPYKLASSMDPICCNLQGCLKLVPPEGSTSLVSILLTFNGATLAIPFPSSVAMARWCGKITIVPLHLLWRSYPIFRVFHSCQCKFWQKDRFSFGGHTHLKLCVHGLQGDMDISQGGLHIVDLFPHLTFLKLKGLCLVTHEGYSSPLVGDCPQEQMRNEPPLVR